jgi:catechol 2,3-dioxygenase
MIWKHFGAFSVAFHDFFPGLGQGLPPVNSSEKKRAMTTISTAVIRPSLHHVTMKTSRLDEMIEWYGLVLGTQVQFRNEVAAWTSNDEANHRIAFLAMPGLGDDADKIRHNGMHHCAFEYASFVDLMSSYDRLRKAGAEPAFCVDHGLTFSIYYEDPEGNYVELQCDNFSDWKLSTEYMRTSRAFSENPIGVFFDPARVYESFKSGADFRTLQKDVRAGRYLPGETPNIGLPA